MKNKVVIIGCGNVGMSYAYSLVNQKTKVTEIVLIDINKNRAIGEAMDLNHGLPFAPGKISVSAGDYNDCSDASIVCICAGANQGVGETRLDLAHKNYEVFKIIIDKVVLSGFNGIFLVATNPVDIMTHITYKLSNFDSSKVIGSGTTLDTARLRYLIGKQLDINTKNVHAYVMGEHGDSEFVPWSNAYVGSTKMEKFLDKEILNEISEKVKNAAYYIIERKGATYYSIGMVLTRITNAILDNENTILTVSSYILEYDLFIGVPSVVNRNGVDRIFDIELTIEEKQKLDKSAAVIKKEINSLE